MAGEEREKRCEVAECGVVGCGSSSCDGFVNAVEIGPSVGDGHSVWSSGECFQKYKRRKRTRMGSELHKDDTLIADKFVNQKMFSLNSSSGVETNLPEMDLHDVINVSDDCSLLRRRNIILKHMHQSLSEGGGVMKRCIQDALAFHPDSGGAKAVKETVHLCEDRDNCPSQTGWVPNTENLARGDVDVGLDVSLNEQNRHTLSELCQRFFFEILISQNFAQLCNICLENFQGMKVGSFLDVSLIDSRLKEGAYESSPMLFRSDIQQIWTKIQKFGTDIIALAKALSEKSMDFSCGKVGGSVHSTSDDGKDEFLTGESYQNSEPEQTEACGVYKVCTCRLCGDKADGKDCLVCGLCEERFHISCIEPAVEEIPVKSWYCTNCTNRIQKLTAPNLDPPHENCVVCERLNARRSPRNGNRDNVIMTKGGDFDGSSRIHNLSTGQIESQHENCVVCERLNAPKPPTNGAGEKVILRNEGRFAESTHGSNHIHNLTTQQTESFHDNCVVCERLNAPRPPPNGDGDNVISTDKGKYVDLEPNCTNRIQKLIAPNLDPPHENCVVCERLNASRPPTNADRDNVIMRRQGNFDRSNRIHNHTTGQFESPHENCVVCERLNAPEPPTNGAGDNVILRNEGKFAESTHGTNSSDNITSPQTVSLHENCVVCERQNAPRPPPNGDGDNVITTDKGKYVDLEESSNGLDKDGLDLLKSVKYLNECNMCHTGVVKKEKHFRVCGHSFCPHRYYHVGCLTRKQLKSYGPSWYCPSCLCRFCHSDRDNHKLVLCHVCDRAYHIFCMKPPHTKIPKRKWFCRKCDKTLQRIHEVRQACENELKKRDEEGKAAFGNFENGCEEKREKAFDYSCGLDMLLNAAKTLNYEENLASNR